MGRCQSMWHASNAMQEHSAHSLEKHTVPLAFQDPTTQYLVVQRAQYAKLWESI